MKALLRIFAIISLVVVCYSAGAQTVKKTAHAVKKEARKVGNKTAEIASKSKATITDKVYKNKVGPEGQTVYIDDHSRYYWIDKKGHRNYLAEGELKERTKD